MAPYKSCLVRVGGERSVREWEEWRLSSCSLKKVDMVEWMVCARVVERALVELRRRTSMELDDTLNVLPRSRVMNLCASS
jgi:hypothetical protein